MQIPVLTDIQKGLIALAVLALIGCGIGYEVVSYGAARFADGEAARQRLWDIEEKAEIDAKNEAIKQQEIANAEDEKRRKTDVAAATGKAARDAVNKFLRDGGMLPSGGKVCGAQSGDGGDARNSVGLNDAAGESRPGGEAALEQFGLKCARDAMRLGRWQDIATKNHWKIIPAE